MKQIYDWEQLKREYFKSDIIEVTEFIRQKMGKEQNKDRNVARHIKGWTQDKKNYKRKQAEELEKKARSDLFEKLKVGLEELLSAKKLSYGLITKYLECHGKQVQGQVLTKAEIVFMKSINLKSVDVINKWLQIELGLPTNISELQGSKEKPLALIELIRKAEKAEKEADEDANN